MGEVEEKLMRGFRYLQHAKDVWRRWTMEDYGKLKKERRAAGRLMVMSTAYTGTAMKRTKHPSWNFGCINKRDEAL